MKEKLLNLIDEMVEAEYLCMTDMKWVADRIREFAEDNANPIDPDYAKGIRPNGVCECADCRALRREGKPDIETADYAEFKAWKENRGKDTATTTEIELRKVCQTMLGLFQKVDEIIPSKEVRQIMLEARSLLSRPLAPKPEAKTEIGLWDELCKDYAACEQLARTWLEEQKEGV